MLTFTIGTAREKDEIPRNSHMLYIIRKSDTTPVLYVGQSHQPFRRLRAHLYRDHEHQIGREIGRDLPDSLEWHFVLYTADECEPMVRRHLPTRYEEFREKRQWCHPCLPEGYGAVNLAELALIRHYQPPFNTVHKARPSRVLVRDLILEALESENPDYPTLLHRIADALNLPL